MPPKTVPRTKGNVRAANSSRAAELSSASSTGSSLPMSALGGFAQFATPAFSASSTYVASTAARSAPMSRSGSGSSSPQLSSGPSFGGLDSDVVSVIRNGELSMIIKRLMSKRDTTTKIRALEDLEKWIKAHPEDDEAGSVACQEAIGPWIKLYIKLTTDVDRRVRLMANNVHLLLVKRVKKKLAPYLKEVVAAWIGTFFDPTRDVARVALEAFKSAFPDNKREQVISFCLQDVIYYISEALLNKTPETLSDPRFNTKEEMDTRYARVAASALHTIGYIIDNLSSEALEKGADDIGPLLDDTRLWAFTSHVNPGVRRASYSMLRTVTSKAPSLIKDRLPIISKQFLPAVFNDKDITTHGDLWDSLLVFTRAFPESWTIPADKKPTMILFFSFLKHAGYGSTTVTYRSILPLISTWADESVLGKNGTGFPFVQDFFENFWRGIESSNMDRDPGATGLFLEAYIECLVYFIVRFGKSETTKQGQDAVFAAFTTLIKQYLTSTDGSKISTKFMEEEQGAARKIATHLQRLLNIPSVRDRATMDLWAPAVDTMSEIMSDDSSEGYVKRGKRAILLLSQLSAIASEKGDTVVAESIEKAADRLVQIVAKQCSGSQSFGPSQLLSSLAVQFEVVVFSNPASQKAMHEFFDKQFADMLLTSDEQSSSGSVSDGSESLPHLLDLFAGYLDNAKEHDVVSGIWRRVMDKVLDSTGEDSRKERQQIILRGLLDRTASSKFAFALNLDSIDKFIFSAIEKRDYIGSETCEGLVASALCSKKIVSDVAKLKIVVSLSEQLEQFVSEIIGGHHSELLEETSSLLAILHKSLAHVAPLSIENSAEEPMKRIIVSVFDLGSQTGEHLNEAGKKSLNELQLLSEESEDVRFLLTEALTAHIQRSIQDLSRVTSPEDLANQARKLCDMLHLSELSERFRLLSKFFFDKEHWTGLYKHLLKTGPQPSLAMLDPVVEALYSEKISHNPDAHPQFEKGSVDTKYDSFGLSAYGRLALFTFELLKKEGDTISLFLTFPEKMTWIMEELLKVRQGCLDSIQAPSSEAGVFFSTTLHADANAVVFRTLLRELGNMATSWITLVQDNDWEKQTINVLTSGPRDSDVNNDEDDEASINIEYFAKAALKEQDGYSERVFADVIQALAKSDETDVSTANAKGWCQVLKSDKISLPVLTGLTVALKARLENTNEFTNLLNYWASELGATRPHEVTIRNTAIVRRLVLLVIALSTGNEDGTSSNLPQHRAMNLLQAIRRWTTDSDALQAFDDQGELLLQSVLYKLLNALSFQVQELPGAHWEMMFGMISAVFAALETSNVTGSNPYAMLALESASRLAVNLIELGQDEDDILSAWEDQSDNILVSAMRLIGQKASTDDKSLRMDRPVRQYLEILSQVCGHAPDRLVLSHGSVAEQCQMLLEPLTALQMLAYKQLLVELTEQVQVLSIQMEIKAPTSPMDEDAESEDTGSRDDSAGDKMVEPKFPKSLWTILSNPPKGFPAMDVNVDADDESNLKEDFSLLSVGHDQMEEEEEEYGVGAGVAAKAEKTMSHSVLGYLLAWKLAFGLFENTTYTVKSGLVAQLRDASTMNDLLPYLFHLLGIHSALSSSMNESSSNNSDMAQSSQPFDLSRWDITDYQVTGFDLSSPEIGFPLLAGHLYYTCLGNVPSLVRIWWTECKFRQLSIAVESLTERYFSPLLIAREINSLIKAQQAPAQGGTAAAAAALSGVSDDLNQLQIKTSKATSEITASFQIDEATMEIAIRLPSNFPLRQVEVEGLQRVGVKEARWRAWLLAVAGVVAAQNGSLIDALSLFRRNVGLHFDGVEDCTICYSIVSVLDRSLPNKTCKTCKHRFHASCLYKWFRTSNSSSCPLCRTLW
ncbi:hypothetical protein MVEG_10120 [Podila verticillata NRRL 6337]|nr:hypothetical protein MVEG_10120 [Podila verticillata NRRL 6337]